MKTIADLAALPDLDKLILLETQPAMQLNEQSWTQDGGNDDWYYDIPAAVAQYGEIVKVEEDGVAYDEEFSAADCHGNASSFYYDDLAQRLYIHTSGSDDPASVTNGTPDYSLVAFFWKGFANRPKIVERFDQLIVDPIFNFWDSATDAEFYTEGTAGTSTVTRDTTVYDDSIHLYSCKITIDAGGDSASTYQQITTKHQRKHKVKIRYKTNSGGTASLLFRNSGVDVYLNPSSQWQIAWVEAIVLSESTSWIEREIEFVTHASYNTYELRAVSSDPNAQIWIQKLEVYRYRQPVYYKPLLPSTLPGIQQSVGSYIFPENQISIGEMAIINDGWYWDLRPGDVYLWHNKRMICKCGSDAWDYEDMPTFFFGLMREPRSDIEEVRLAGYDDRLNLRTIPTDRLVVGTFANCDPNWLEKPAPFALGSAVKYFEPPSIDTANFIYQPSQATFGGVTYGINDITGVKKAGALQTSGVDYTEDATNGRFTMTGDPGTDQITCIVEGLKVSQFGDAYAWRPADFLYFYLVIMNGIDKHRLNMAALSDLFTNRNMACFEWVTDSDTIDLINRLQQAALFQLFTRLDGTIETRRYRSDVPTDVLRLYTRDFIDWEEISDTNHTYGELVVKTRYDFLESIYEHVHSPTAPPFDPDKIGWEHDIKDRLEIETPLTTTLQANTMWKNYMSIMEDPIKILRGTVKNHGALLLNPTDKIKVTIKVDYDGTEKTVFDDVTFQIYHLDKDLNTVNTYFEAFVGWGALFWVIT